MYAKQEQMPVNIQRLSSSYEPWWADVSGHLGGIYPFFDKRYPEQCSLDIGMLIDARKSRGIAVQLDSAALVAKAALPHLLGNRTLLKDIYRAPWMCTPDSNGDWRPAHLPPHGAAQPDPEIFVRELRAALLNEVCMYINDARTVGILLSGGMDSRVLAAVVRAIQEEMGSPFDVVGLTWGAETSRDVIYAQRITQRFGWHWQHYPITSDTLAANISHMARMGAEVSPLHLHAMPEVAATHGLNVVLAGSYGDSIGRAEFSGRRVAQLKDVLPTMLDRFGVLRKTAVEATAKDLKIDVGDTPHFDTGTSRIRRHEIEQQMHYMRRMLQSCMTTIALKTRFYQLFSSPAVFGLMWGLDPSRRNDQWYARLLPLLPGDLLDIPWARTGKRYQQIDGNADIYDKQYHAYGHWLRGELNAEVLRRVNSERIRGLGIFNDQGLELAIRAWAKARTKTTNSLDELLSWLASLHDFIEHFQLDAPDKEFKPCFLDSPRALLGGAKARVFVEARNRLRD